MHIILGATGHVGSATAKALLEQGQSVTIVTRDPDKGAQWKERGAIVAVADVLDTRTLKAILQTGTTAFLLNPPAAPSTDTDVEERRTAASIVAALDGSGLRHVVVESTYGAQAGSRLGDLNTLFEFEERLRTQAIPARIIRAAYYLSNWDALFEGARQCGVLPTMFPDGFKIPMVAPEDLGLVAARLLCADHAEAEPVYVEGPERYEATDVANAFAVALGRVITVEVIPRPGWEQAFRDLGFSEAAAQSYARMTSVTVDKAYDMPTCPERGTITLRQYVAGLARRSATA